SEASSSTSSSSSSPGLRTAGGAGAGAEVDSDATGWPASAANGGLGARTSSRTNRVQDRSPDFNWKVRVTLLSPEHSSNFPTRDFLPVLASNSPAAASNVSRSNSPQPAFWSVPSPKSGESKIEASRSTANRPSSSPMRLAANPNKPA